ncbi:hypothetical protein D9757_001649 [Collybiopsis confluens]|uniref:Zn(2)-C6 fungal-type domain-containing protein n=1 Tax=Collybiopsis confluens TaxID=2823264 RepID=A0A8H5HYH8_9AGAR|nr:hypothetical protein D9757_001649 [Collybiopsis confluens]
MSSPSQSNLVMDPSIHHPLMNTRPLITYSSMPMHMYPLSPTSQRSLRTKRRQVKNACTNCQRACKKCDDARPCLRCIKYGIPSSDCVNSTRKERKKGVKRGPYKKRDCKGRAGIASADQLDDSAEYDQVSSTTSNGEPAESSSPTTLYYMAPPTSLYTAQFMQPPVPSSLPPPKPSESRPVVDPHPHHMPIYHNHPSSLYVVYPPPPMPPPPPVHSQPPPDQRYSTPPPPPYFYQPGPVHHRHPYPAYHSYASSSLTPHHDPNLHQQPLMLHYSYQAYLGEHGAGGES